MPICDIEQPDQLLAYLRDGGHVAPNESPRITVLAGGVSNRTVLVTFADGRAWVLKQALAKLRVKVDWFSDPARVHREAAGLRWLVELAPPHTTTPLVFEDHDRHIIAMQAVPEPHENWKTMLLAGRVEDDHVDQFGTLLGKVHRAAAARRAEVAPVFADRAFFESLRLEPYYAYAAEQVPEAVDFMHGLIADTRARRETLVHGDYSPKNILVHHGRLILLDHEVIHFGDPMFDVGFAMTHLLSKAHHLPDHRPVFLAAAGQFWRAYQNCFPDRETLTVAWADLEQRAVRHTLGCLLARVAGRSTLEYLDDVERLRQRRAVVTLMATPPDTIADLIESFARRLSVGSSL